MKDPKLLPIQAGNGTMRSLPALSIVVFIKGFTVIQMH
jgi:hypothetical protein